ncbi:5,6-dimethylbenzimidazole synthase [Modestobacter sp. NPDC049651]|uniref:5,6-dimethylbenzimidazole synthase n=1 Tax=unclassified Modestobacter TaxID=2643866 RepID=UPI0033E415F1
MSTYPRPVPLIGDPTAASERAADPAGWAFDPAERDAFYRVVAARRDVRRYRPDPVPADVLGRVLTAAHAAPSVGHSQPWRFVVVTDPGVRDRAAVLTDRERLRQAAQLEPDAARRLLDLKLEGVRDAPLGVVVCCDRRTPAAGVLGRATFPDADLWSCAAAIQNLWLAARAEGLGMGWVTLFRPADLAELLGLPDGVVTLGWLCLGWPDERPPSPGLERAGWSRRLPLADVVATDHWPGSAPPPSALRGPDQPDVVAARDGGDRLLTPPGSLGVLDAAVDRAAALGRGDATGGVLVLAAADHPVVAHGVSAFDPRTTRDVTTAAVAGSAVGVTTARGAGLDVVVVDAGVAGGPVPGAVTARPAGPQGDLVHAAALTAADAAALVAAGRELGAAAAGAGVVALGEVGVGNTTVAAALACAMLHVEPAAVVGLGSGADSAMLARKNEVVNAALARAGGVEDPLTALAELGGPELAVLTGVTLGAAEQRAVVVVDGFAASLAALVAVQLEPAVQACLVAGQRSRERGHDLVLQALGCEPLLDLRLRAGEGVGAVLAASLLLQGLAVRRTAARVDR